MRWLALLIMAASGFAGLGYQIVWTQQGALWLGHESAAVLAVITAFFGGLALGSFAFGPHIEKSKRPAHWYAGCEIVIALWGVVLTLVMAPFSEWALRLIGATPSALWQWSVAFLGTFALLLPSTAAMGATLPAMEKVTAHLRSGGRSIAALYASNTFGAVVGVLAAAFWLIPELGLTRTAIVCITLNLLCGVGSLALLRPLTAPEPVKAQKNRVVLLRLAITGLLGIGYEVLVVRVLSQVSENTVYTFAMLLAVYLIGTAAGAAAYQRWLAKHEDRVKVRDLLLCALACACLLGTASLWAAESIKAQALNVLGATMTAAITSEALLALIAFAPATVVMGALFSHLNIEASRAGVSFGRAIAVNTLGAALAPILFGVIAFPLLGPKASLLIVSAGYLALITRHRALRPIALAPAGATLAIAFLAPRLAFIDIPEGGRVVSYREGAMAAVSVVEDAQGVLRLRINNRQQEGSSATQRVDGRQGLLPVFLHPSPHNALFLGLGTGITASSAALDPALKVEAVELLPEVIEASALFITNPRVQLIAADARRYVRASEQRYDVIISDNFHPARSGSGSLYTVEHFRAVRERLATDGGLFCQWLPLHQLDLDTLRSIVRSFIAVYPHGSAILASNSLETPVIGLIGTAGDKPFDLNALRTRLSNKDLAAVRATIGIEDELALLGTFIAGPTALKRFAADAPLNTDDRPVVAYRAPKITYAPDSLPRDRLFALLGEFTVTPTEIIAQEENRLAAYWHARDRFIESGKNIRPSADVRAMLAQAREPLLESLRISPDFRPAYDPLLRMAIALSQSDAPGARALLNELSTLQPARPEAQAALAQLQTR